MKEFTFSFNREPVWMLALSLVPGALGIIVLSLAVLLRWIILGSRN